MSFIEQKEKKKENLTDQFREIFELFLDGDYRRYKEEMKKVHLQVSEIPLTEREQGELYLLESLVFHLRLEEWIPRLEKAWQKLGGYSEVIPRKTDLVLENGSPFYLYLSEPGKADETREVLYQAERIWDKLTGSGMLVSLLYEAQLAYFRGNLEEAEPKIRQVFGVARENGQEFLALCAAELLSFLQKHGYDGGNWKYAMDYVQRSSQRKYSRGKFCTEYAKCIRYAAWLSLGMLKNIPEWIYEEDLGIVRSSEGFEVIGHRISPNSVGNVLMMKTQYLAYSGHPVEALNTADLAGMVYGLAFMPMYDCYLCFLRAGCYLQLDMVQEAEESLARGVAYVAPDGFWLLAAEFEPAFKEMLYDVIRPYGEQAEESFEKIGKGFWEKLGIIREKHELEDRVSHLTKREQEIAYLAAEGMRNDEIGEKLGISRWTVKHHLMNVFSKLEIDRRGMLKEVLGSSKSRNLALWVEKKRK